MEETNSEVKQKEREAFKCQNLNNEELEDATITKEREHEEKKQEQQKEEPEMKEENVEHESRDFPDSFFCPLTGKIMKDPVVHPDGTSFERSAVADLSDDVIYYPNRALQAIIQQEVLRRNIPLQQTIHSMRKSFLGLVQRSNLSLNQDAIRPLSDQYYCSITFDIMKNPVIDPDGHTFDRRAIINWLRINGNSPATRNPLSAKKLYKNTAIKNLINEEVDRDDESVNTSIGLWKEQIEEDDDDEEWDLEEGNFPDSDNGATTPTSMEEIEERQRRRREKERCSRFRMYLILAIVLVGLAYFPYTTTMILLLTTIMVVFVNML